jgi:hypothetical protein
MNGGIRPAMRLLLVTAAPLALAGCVLEALLFVRTGDIGTFTGDTLISACASASSPGGPTVTCQIGAPGNLITTSIVAGGGGTFAISPWDPLILEVPAGATSFAGTFFYTIPGLPPSPVIPLVVTAGLSSLQIDAKTTLLAEAGTQLVVVDVPSDLSLPNEINYTLHYSDASHLPVKAMFAVKVRSGVSTYYAPILPCATDFASLPGVPASGNLTMPQILAYVSAMTPCNNKAFDFSPGTPPPPPPAGPNYQGIWWKSPPDSESGWGLNLAHQEDTIFASWFTYDMSGRHWWLTMTATKTAAGTYSGTLYQTRGPPFNAVPWDPFAVVPTQVGTGTLTFSDANNGTFFYTIGAVTQAKAITREVFGPLPTCTYDGGSLILATNYTDLWWAKPGGSESGWGINLNHEGDTIFATWFTYDLDHTPLWLVVTAPKQSTGAYSGDLYQTSGARFDAFDPAQVTATKVGTATFTFAEGNDATFQYTVQLPGMASPVTQAKLITREVFSLYGTTCR